MHDGWAALFFETAKVSDDALALGFALALAGHGVEQPRLDVASLEGIPRWSVALYRSGIRARGHGDVEELAHARDVFTGDVVTPAVGVRLAAGDDVQLHTWVYSSTFGIDIGESFASGASDESVEFDDTDLDDADLDDADLDDADLDDANLDDANLDDARPNTADDLAPSWDGAAGRLAAAFGKPIAPEVARALFVVDRTLSPVLAPSSVASVSAFTNALVRALRRVPGRGAAVDPGSVHGVPPPASYSVFASAYDWADPHDEKDLYREVAIGRIQGSFRFFRPGEARPTIEAGSAYPVAEVLSSHLSAPQRVATVFLRPDGASLVLVQERRPPTEAGPTWGELLRYLALGWSRRDELHEEVIQALMLRAAVRCA